MAWKRFSRYSPDQLVNSKIILENLKPKTQM